MASRLHPSLTPCRHILAAGHCPSGDDCSYAHDSVPQPCLSASQLTHQLTKLRGEKPADPAHRRRNANLTARFRYKAMRRLVAPALVRAGVEPTKKTIKAEFAKITGRVVVMGDGGGIGAGGGEGGGGDGGGEEGSSGSGGSPWTAAHPRLRSNERRMHKMAYRRKVMMPSGRPSVRFAGTLNRHRSEQVSRAGQVRIATIEARGGPPESAPAPGAGGDGVFMGPYLVTAGASSKMVKVEDDDDANDWLRRVEKIGDFTVKYPNGRPAHLEHLEYLEEGNPDLDW